MRLFKRQPKPEPKQRLGIQGAAVAAAAVVSGHPVDDAVRLGCAFSGRICGLTVGEDELFIEQLRWLHEELEETP